MSLYARYILLREQLKSKKTKICHRCNLPYNEAESDCPHCAGLNERQLEELIDKQKKIQTGNVFYIIFVFVLLAAFFALFQLIH